MLTRPLDPFDQPRRVLGIRLERFDRPEKPDGPSPRIEVGLFNASDALGGVGGCFWVSYAARRVGNRWTVERVSRFDP